MSRFGALVECFIGGTIAVGMLIAEHPPHRSRRASGVSGLFAGFFATMEGSDFSRSFFIGFDSSALNNTSLL
jgi:hypothetical protein